MATLMFGEVSTELITIVSFIGGIILISVICSIGGFLHYRRERLLMHAERMNALELGRDMPDDPATARLKATYQAEQAEKPEEPSSTPGAPKSPASQCYSTTTSVCCTGFVFAWLSGTNLAVAVAIASATGAVGVTGLICGTVLASKSTEPSRMVAHSKPIFDPEAV
jgi:hypothetical protein